MRRDISYPKKSLFSGFLMRKRGESRKFHHKQGHPSIESLRRELPGNSRLQELCGFELLDGERAVTFIPDILPLAFRVTPAGASELKRLTPVMGSLREHNPELLQNSKKYAFPNRPALFPENPSEMHREKPVNQGNLHYSANDSSFILLLFLYICDIKEEDFLICNFISGVFHGTIYWCIGDPLLHWSGAPHVRK